ncbi:MAG: cbb3-type cytochrome c oxidase subunit II [Verrucomicrobiota bacterium]
MSFPGNRSAWAAVGVVAATYVYFLIFAEFAFLALARSWFADAGTVKLVMAGLGAGGVTGSVAAAATFDMVRWRGRLAVWFAACALAAVVVVGVASAGAVWPVWLLAGAGIGLTLGGLTVTLATGLRAACGPGLGWVCGAGTGLAYAVCNVPVVFGAEPLAQCWIAVAVAAAGAGLSLSGWLRMDAVADAPSAGGMGWGRWLVVLAALVWMDSAAFAVIQQEWALRAAMWGGAGHLWAYAALHLLAALWAGWALRSGRERLAAGGAWLLLAVACAWLAWRGGTDAGAAGWPYVMAVSLYSALLVFVPARLGRRWVSAAVYGGAGWVGSALGIGMAQDLSGIPTWFAPATGVVVLTVLLARPGVVSRWLLLVIGGLGLASVSRGDEIARGREVYVGEGCIHCHSQYVRPGTSDVERWGPVVPLSESLRERPPLYGNRRQGPDLTNVGLRRTTEWNRLHLMDPRAVAPGSRMPGYAYLFSGDGRRGEDLLAYLASLGEGRLEERAGLVGAWRPRATEAEVVAVDARRLFTGLCAPCHGPEGRGDGPVAAGLTVPPPDFGQGWRRPLAGDVEGVARLVKFGLPGTSMAGHEALSDAEAVSLARLVASLHVEATSP